MEVFRDESHGLERRRHARIYLLNGLRRRPSNQTGRSNSSLTLAAPSTALQLATPPRREFMRCYMARATLNSILLALSASSIVSPLIISFPLPDSHAHIGLRSRKRRGLGRRRRLSFKLDTTTTLILQPLRNHPMAPHSHIPRALPKVPAVRSPQNLREPLRIPLPYSYQKLHHQAGHSHS